MYTITVSNERLDKEYQLTGIRPYQTLLEVCLNHGIPLNHDCGGVCHCTTCHIYIEKGAQFLAEPSRREIHFLKRCANLRSVSRLACQCLLNENEGSIEISVPEQKEE